MANYAKIAIKLSLNGVYIPSFNKKINLISGKPRNFLVLGSAHNLPQIRVKEKQGAECIFLAPLFLNKYISRTYLKQILKSPSPSELVN